MDTNVGSPESKGLKLGKEVLEGDHKGACFSSTIDMLFFDDCYDFLRRLASI
jgi:hypothetical protein